MDASWGELPSHWLVYFAVNDTDEVASRAKGLGGTITVAPFDETAGGSPSSLTPRAVPSASLPELS